MSWGGGNKIASWLGMSESNSLVRTGLVPNFNSASGILAPGMETVTQDIPALFKVPEMPGVEPLASPASTSNDTLKNAARLEAERLRKRKGMKSTILTGDSAMMAPAQTQKAELLG